MSGLLKTGAAFALIVILLRLRWNLGLVMMLGAALLGSLYLMGPIEQAGVMLRSSIDIVTINVVVALALIMVLENIIRMKGLLRRMSEALVNIARDRRIAMAVLPGVIGLLPSAGGAAFSAPMVQEAAGGEDVPAERKAFINYWFRHIWEYVSPLYPGIVLAAAITGIPFNALILSQLPLPVAVIAAGTVFGFRGFPGGKLRGKRNMNEIKALIISIMPIIAAIVMVVIFNVNLSLAMAGIVAVMFALYRYSPRDMFVTLRESVSFNVLLMVAGIMVFKGMLEATGSVGELSVLFERSGLPSGMIVFALPFLVGMLTGHTVGFVGSTFPIIMAMTAEGPTPGIITFAFASGFAGVMLSPVHLCLLLTVKYFNADIAGVYRLLYIPVLLVFAVGLVRLWI